MRCLYIGWMSRVPARRVPCCTCDDVASRGRQRSSVDTKAIRPSGAKVGQRRANVGHTSGKDRTGRAIYVYLFSRVAYRARTGIVTGASWLLGTPFCRITSGTASLGVTEVGWICRRVLTNRRTTR